MLVWGHFVVCTRRHLPKISWSWKVKTNRAHELPRKIPGKTSSQSTSGNSWASQCDANWRSTMQQRDLRLSVKRRMKASSIDSTMTTLGDLSNLNSLLSTGLETKSTTTFEVQSGQIFWSQCCWEVMKRKISSSSSFNFQTSVPSFVQSSGRKLKNADTGGERERERERGLTYFNKPHWDGKRGREMKETRRKIQTGKSE